MVLKHEKLQAKSPKAFGEFFKYLPDPQPVVDFIRRQVNNTRTATKKKAEAFLKKHQRNG